MSEQTATLATVENMRRAEQAGIRCFAFSPTTGEEYSATSGDYWNLGAETPLMDDLGEPMILVQRVTIYRDALTRETL
jgi:hypothetical protein